MISEQIKKYFDVNQLLTVRKLKKEEKLSKLKTYEVENTYFHLKLSKGESSIPAKMNYCLLWRDGGIKNTYVPTILWTYYKVVHNLDAGNLPILEARLSKEVKEHIETLSKV